MSERGNDYNPYDQDADAISRREFIRRAGWALSAMATTAGVYEFVTQVIPKVAGVIGSISLPNSSADSTSTPGSTTQAPDSTPASNTPQVVNPEAGPAWTTHSISTKTVNNPYYQNTTNYNPYYQFSIPNNDITSVFYTTNTGNHVLDLYVNNSGVDKRSFDNGRTPQTTKVIYQIYRPNANASDSWRTLLSEKLLESKTNYPNATLHVSVSVINSTDSSFVDIYDYNYPF